MPATMQACGLCNQGTQQCTPLCMFTACAADRDCNPGIVEACTNPCGSGMRTCDGCGHWGACMGGEAVCSSGATRACTTTQTQQNGCGGGEPRFRFCDGEQTCAASGCGWNAGCFNLVCGPWEC